MVPRELGSPLSLSDCEGIHALSDRQGQKGELFYKEASLRSLRHTSGHTGLELLGLKGQRCAEVMGESSCNRKEWVNFSGAG